MIDRFIIGLWLLYFMGVGLKFRVEQAWLILPAFFFLLSILIAAIDVNTSETEAVLFGLSWSFYPILVILIFLVILPIVTFTGKETRPPLEMLKEIIELEKAHQEE